MAPAPGQAGAILVVSPVQDDHAALSRILAQSPAVPETAQNCREAREFLSREGLAVVVCERLLPDGDWKDMLRMVARLPRPPKLVVTSRPVDQRLWAEVLNLGGYDVLAKPFDAAEVRWVVGAARRQWVDVSGGGALAGGAAV